MRKSYCASTGILSGPSPLGPSQAAAPDISGSQRSACRSKFAGPRGVAPNVFEWRCHFRSAHGRTVTMKFAPVNGKGSPAGALPPALGCPP